MIKKITAIFLSAVLLLSTTLPAAAAEASARTITIQKTEGTVTMTKGAAQSFTAREGLKLYDGYTVSTDKDSSCYLRMDEDSLLKMDNSTKIQISKTSSSKLSASVLSGGVSVDAAKQKQGETIEIRAGNSALAIRGTLLTAEFLQEGEFEVTMLSGSGEVDGTPLPAGSTMFVYDTTDNRLHEIKQLELNETSSLLTLKTIDENRDALIAERIFTSEELEILPELITNAQNLLVSQQAPAAVLSGEVNYLEEEQPVDASSDGGGGGGGGGGTPTPPVSTGATATINNASPGTPVSISGNQEIAAGQTATLQSGTLLNIATGATLTINGTLNIASGATISNSGTIVNASGNSLHCDGIFFNDGTFENASSGLSEFAAGSSFVNNGTFIMSGGEFTINGNFDNEHAFLMNGGDFISNGSFNSAIGSYIDYGAGGTFSGTATPNLSGLAPTLNNNVFMVGLDGFYDLARCSVMLNGSTVYYINILIAAQDALTYNTTPFNITLLADDTLDFGTYANIQSNITIYTGANTLSLGNDLGGAGNEIYNLGVIIVNSGGMLEILDNFVTYNLSEIICESGGIIENRGTFTNDGEITVEAGGNFTNTYNYSNSNSGTLAIHGSFEQQDAFSNYVGGTVSITGSFTCDGPAQAELNNGGLFEIDGGQFIMESGSSFANHDSMGVVGGEFSLLSGTFEMLGEFINFYGAVSLMGGDVTLGGNGIEPIVIYDPNVYVEFGTNVSVDFLPSISSPSNNFLTDAGDSIIDPSDLNGNRFRGVSGWWRQLLVP